MALPCQWIAVSILKYHLPIKVTKTLLATCNPIIVIERPIYVGDWLPRETKGTIHVHSQNGARRPERCRSRSDAARDSGIRRKQPDADIFTDRPAYGESYADHVRAGTEVRRPELELELEPQPRPQVHAAGVRHPVRESASG